MKKKLVVVISIGMILICGSVFAITAVVNSNYEKESIEKSSKVINNNVEENLDSIYSKSDTEVIINNLESENLGGTGTINRSSIEENTETFYTASKLILKYYYNSRKYIFFVKILTVDL